MSQALVKTQTAAITSCGPPSPDTGRFLGLGEVVVRFD
jgi:hypothetical protein